MHNQQIGGGRLENAYPAPIDQSIGINRSGSIDRILHNQQIGGGRLENADPAPIDQSIKIDRWVCSAIKLSPARGIHQCSKQGIGALNNDKRGSCTISILGGGRLENANPALTDQLIGIDRWVCSAIKLSPARGIHQCSKQGIGALNNDRRGSCTISILGVDASRMLIRLV
ncbi:unnamed protein product [Sphagnum tenellum]